jgi:predicted transcriptional regulator of viral defense system
VKFGDLLRIVGDEPVFETGLLLCGPVDAADVRRQLSRWTSAGKVIQLRRGLYALAPPFRRATPHPFVIANRLVTASYVSAESALAFYGLIPEFVPVTVSATTSRPGRRDTELGRFVFRHLERGLFFGMGRVDLGEGQSAWVATPEKALLDLVHLAPGGDRPEYLAALRLQNLERLDLRVLEAMAGRKRSPKLRRAAQNVAKLAREEAA